MKHILAIILFTLLFQSAKAQFEIDGQIRPRFEHRNGYKQLRDSSTTSANFISQRTRLRFAYKKDNLVMKISFQDVHVWGDIAPKKTQSGLIGLHEGWAKFNFNKETFIIVGRQEIAYDNGRVLTQANWNQIGFTHDAIKLGYHINNWEFETALAYNQDGQIFGTDYFAGLSFYKFMNTIWVSRKFDNLTISVLNIADVRQKNDTTYIDYLRNTIGPTIQYKTSKLGIDLRAYYQNGKLQSGSDVSAFYLNTDISYKIVNKLTAIVGFELMSGTDATDITNTTNNSFDIMYGARHKFNGLIDYFSTPVTTGNAGLVDIYLKAKFNATDKISLVGQFHNFRLHNNYVDNNDNTIDKALGNEIDLSAKIKFSKTVQLDLGLASMLGTESLEIIKGGDRELFTTWGFVMLTIKPTLFKQ